MKLSFLIYSYFPYGGLQRDFLRVVKECLSRGHELTVYTLSWEGDIPEGCDVVLVPANTRNRIRRNEAYTAWVAAELAKRERCPVIGFNKMPLLDIYFAADPCFMQKATTQRGFYYKLTSRYRHFKRYEEAVFGAQSNTRALILSPQQRVDFEYHYPECGQRLQMTPPGISPDRKPQATDQSANSALRAEVGLPEGCKLILQVGSGFRVKGVDRSLRAVAALPKALRESCHYLLIGQDNPNRFLKLAKSLGIEDQFSVLPGRDDIPRFLSAADIMLHPAYSESAGYVLLEATIAGLPVLTTATCGYAFHIEEAGSGLVCAEPFEQQQLNAKLAQMLAELDSAHWSKNGLAYGEKGEHYSQAAFVADFIENFSATDF